MVDLHHSTVAAGPSRGHHFAVGGGAHGITRGRAEIQARMHRRATEKRIAADPEAAGEFHFADHGLAIWHQGEGPVEPIELHPGDVYAIKLALEWPRAGRKL